MLFNHVTDPLSRNIREQPHLQLTALFLHERLNLALHQAWGEELEEAWNIESVRECFDWCEMMEELFLRLKLKQHKL